MVIHFGNIFACSRCPGWQTQDGDKAVTHQSWHFRIDVERGICPVCVTPAKMTTLGTVARFLPCGHEHRVVA
jgi:hypothetical protein